MHEIKRLCCVFFIFSFLILPISCARIVTSKQYLNLPSESKICVLPLENLTETPLAGRRVASILEGILRAKGFKVESRILELEERDYSAKEISRLMAEIKEKGIRYVFSGSVNEYRYKTGIDGEPAVSVSISLYDLHEDKIIWSSTGGATGWSYESLGTVTQKLVNKLVIKRSQ